MALERTFSIIKPDAVAKNVIGAIYNRFESAGLRIVASKMIHMSKEQAEGLCVQNRVRHKRCHNSVTFITCSRAPWGVEIAAGQAVNNCL